MAIRPLLQLGHPDLYRGCRSVGTHELGFARRVADDLFDTMDTFRAEHGWGRAIAAPQIGEAIRLIALDVDGRTGMVNPELTFPDDDRMTLWDDCMSFPQLLVEVERFRRCEVRYLDLEGETRVEKLTDGMSELIQHEVDHLDGILTVQRAIGDRSIILRSESPVPGS